MNRWPCWTWPAAATARRWPAWSRHATATRRWACRSTWPSPKSSSATPTWRCACCPRRGRCWPPPSSASGNWACPMKRPGCWPRAPARMPCWARWRWPAPALRPPPGCLPPRAMRWARLPWRWPRPSWRWPMARPPARCSMPAGPNKALTPRARPMAARVPPCCAPRPDCRAARWPKPRPPSKPRWPARRRCSSGPCSSAAWSAWARPHGPVRTRPAPAVTSNWPSQPSRSGAWRCRAMRSAAPS